MDIDVASNNGQSDNGLTSDHNHWLCSLKSSDRDIISCEIFQIADSGNVWFRNVVFVNGTGSPASKCRFPGCNWPNLTQVPFHILWQMRSMCFVLLTCFINLLCVLFSTFLCISCFYLLVKNKMEICTYLNGPNFRDFSLANSIFHC